MRRAVLIATILGLSIGGSPSAAQETKASETTRPAAEEGARETAALKREVDRLKTEVAAMRKQVEELKKTEHDMGVHVDMLLRHRHQLFLNFLRADAFFPQAKGTFFVTTPSPEDLTRTSGPISGPK